MTAATALDTITQTLLRASWQASVLVLVLLLIQYTLGRQLPARWRYNLWLLVLLRLCLPVTPASPFSLYNLTRWQPQTIEAPPLVTVTDTDLTEPPLDLGTFTPASTPAVTHTIQPDPPPSLSQPLPIVPTTPNASEPDPPPFDWRLPLLLLWLAGFLFLITRAIVSTVRVHLRLRRLPTITDPNLLSLLDRCRVELGLRRPVRMLLADDDIPAMVGFLRPRLLLPSSLLSSLRPRELRLVLLHELAHVARHDVAVNYLATLLHAIHWFNPVLWIAFARLRAERELACDERVLSLTSAPEDRQTYGHTLLRLLQSPARRSVSPGTIGILQRPHLMRRRINMIANFRNTNRWALPSAALAIALAAVTLTDGVGAQVSPGGAHPTAPTDAPATPAETLPPNDPNAFATPPQVTVPAVDLSLSLPGAPAAWRPARGPLDPTWDHLVTQETEPTPEQFADAERELWERKYKNRIRIVDGKETNRQEVQAEFARQKEADREFVAEQRRARVRDGAQSSGGGIDPATGVPAPAADPFAAQPATGSPAPGHPTGPSANPTTPGLGAPQQPRPVRRAAVASPSSSTRADEDAIRQVLSRRLPEARFDNVPFSDVINFFRDVTQVNVVVNWRALEAAGIEREAPVTLNLKNITAEQYLRMVEREVGGGSVALGHSVEHGILIISTADDLSAITRVEVYDAFDLFKSVGGNTPQLREELTNLIRSSVDPNSWVDNGGRTGQVSAFGAKLTITQTPENHEQIRLLFEKLRGTPAATDAAATMQSAPVPTERPRR